MLTSPKVLIVEDDRPLNRLFQKSFTAATFHTAQAYSLADALRLLQQDQFSVIVLDLGLPDGQGWEIVDKLGDRLHQIPEVIMVTGREISEIPEAYAQKYHVFRKPVDLTQLIRLAIQLQSKHRSKSL
ncbi:MAG: response regulator [Anaerolineae bacterium]|nr:response regulator [Anaerolineae bacterium]